MNHETLFLLCSCPSQPHDLWVSVTSIKKNRCEVFVSYDFSKQFGVLKFSFSDIEKILDKVSEMINEPVEFDTYIGYNIDTMILDNHVLLEARVSCEENSLSYNLSCTDGEKSIDLEGGTLNTSITDFHFIRQELNKIARKYFTIGDYFNLPSKQIELQHVFC